MENSTEKTRIAVQFAAIDPYIEVNIPSSTEKRTPGRDMVEWGDRNAYPDYLLKLARETPSLNAVLNGIVDYVAGDGITIDPLTTALPDGRMNVRGDIIDEQVRCLARDYGNYGGMALQVIRDHTGDVAEVYYIDFRFLRSNKENTVFYYSENWGTGRHKVLEYPAFYPYRPEQWATLDEAQRTRAASSILYVKNKHTQTYPLPPFYAAIKACETERCIDDYHLNAINNGFTPSQIMNFNSGTPTDEIKQEITKDIKEKFTGHQNGARVLVAFNDDREHQLTVQPVKVEDFGARYDALSKHCRQQIFTSYRANPNLFGIPTDNLGFSDEDYDKSFKLFNRTTIQPMQAKICDMFDRVYGRRGVLRIVPFTLDGGQRVIQ